jgi:hypothetical protein
MQGITATRLGDIYVRREADIVKVRERVRRLAREMGFDPTTQIKITTAVSELTRNIYEYARSGAITLSLATRGAAASGLMITARVAAPASTRPSCAPSSAAATARPRVSASASSARAA